jgi:pimeloyl-ACP methyl ester carboxylesterase
VRARRRRLLKGGLVLLLLIAAWMASGTLAAYVLTRRARPPFAEPGAGYAVPFRELRLRASDGVEIGAWSAERSPARAAVVLVHGNGATRASLADEAAYFYARGCTVLLISVRAHGDSGGDYNDIGWSARRDVIAAVEHLERSYWSLRS